ncbi:hypothetical protein TOPH_00663 [Tolypocladium ophioglossoides CBS 100239]|uniref:Uncharacterized protein n=1 Tax=Tolypocladium ophioglossoides (strain CBS 100239) TaxID=1163406 RepID=A0A0L0NML9_TOLOC|nr:hypothetical protein TOPH_00663 [Tolypocladium ophioglossoides CBS 100239]
MTSFSRGLLLPCRRALLAPRSLILPEQATTTTLTTSASRFFTTSLRFRAVQAAPKITKKPLLTQYAAAKAPPAAQVAPSRYAFIKSLASKQTPTVLYEAPSHFWFYFGCWSSGLSIIAWTALTGPTVVQQPEGIPQWVGVVFGASYVLLGAMGFYLISKTPNIISSIRVLPPPAAAAAAAAGRTLAGPGASFANPQLEVTVKRMVPLLSPKVVTASLDSVALKSRFSLPDGYVPELRRLEQKRDEEARHAKLRKFDMGHLLTMPVRRLGRAFANMFRGVRAAWTDMGYGIIRVDGKEYKVDVTKGFAHDGFRTLERIVTIGWK